MMSSNRILLSIMVTGSLLCLCIAPSSLRAEDPIELFGQYCLDCHTGTDAEGGFDLSQKLEGRPFDATLVFENLATGKMPPADVDAPSEAERSKMLSWLAGQQPEYKPNTFRRKMSCRIANCADNHFIPAS